MMTYRSPELDKAIRQQIIQGLAVPKEDNVWGAVTLAIEFQTRQEMVNALAPNLSSEKRHYNAGRAAALEDFSAFLQQMFAQAHKEKTG